MSHNKITIPEIDKSLAEATVQAIYTLTRYKVESNIAIIACDDHEIDKEFLVSDLRITDIAKNINDHYTAVIFTHVTHDQSRRALQKILNKYPQYNLKAALVMINEKDTTLSIFKRLLQANEHVHKNEFMQIFDDNDQCFLETAGYVVL